MLQEELYLSFSRELLKRFLSVRKKTEELCRPLAVEDFMLSTTQDTSPPKWHLAHTSWFFEKFILKKYLEGYEEFYPEFNILFNSYYKTFGHYLAKEKRSFISRPSLETIFHYRQHVTQRIRFLIEHQELPSEVYALIELGVNHEEQHQELLLMDIKRNFYENPLTPAYYNQSHMVEEILPTPKWVIFEEGLTSIGAKSKTAFSYDNEKGFHHQWIERFALSSHLVTNSEFIEFIEDGGYENPLLWLSDGWDMKEKEGWKHPLYWEERSDGWWTMSFSGMTPLSYISPVAHVSYYEAQAFAKWRGVRLPTEFEWELAARTEPIRGGFLEENNFDPGRSQEAHEQLSQIHGHVWEWTQSAYLPYPKFQELNGEASEYNGKFMCNQFVMRGGSCLTPKAHYRVTYRNFFYPHMRWQFGGIRLAKDA